MTAQEIVENGLFESAVMLMDDEIREEIHEGFAHCTELVFLEEYMKVHEQKYGVPFVV